jgi:NAD(P)-dependent dehydrogenase (short-subunit alcohol dehydrogenase family)
MQPQAAARRGRALVTGAGGTFGLRIAEGLLLKGFDTLCTVRDARKGEELVARLADAAKASPNAAQVLPVIVDLADARSVAAAIAEAAGGEGGDEQLDVLVNNAAFVPQTQNGNSAGRAVWDVNVLGYHRALKAALPALLRAPAPRAVLVASQYAGGLDLDDPLYARRAYEPHAAYKASKQADRMLAAAWAARQPRLAVYSCHPGIAASSVAEGLGMEFDNSVQAARAGAATPVFVATSPADKLPSSGAYFVDKRQSRCAFGENVAAVNALWALLEKSE